MLERIRHFIRSQRDWHASHKKAWASRSTPGPDGLTLFQSECERVIVKALASRGLALSDRQIDPESKEFVTAAVPEIGVALWIYSDQTEIRSPGESLNLEAWDTKNPEEHYDRVADFVARLPLTRNTT